jgi:hypothetical protein
LHGFQRKLGPAKTLESATRWSLIRVFHSS